MKRLNTAGQGRTARQGHTWTELFSVLAPLVTAVAYVCRCQPVSGPPAAENIDCAAADRA